MLFDEFDFISVLLLVDVMLMEQFLRRSFVFILFNLPYNFVLTEAALCILEGIVHGKAAGQVVVKARHQHLGRIVIHLPQAHQQAVGARLLEAPLQTEDP